ncbi:GntR family transcriptional regulator [Aureimonas sp. AU22]|jgi:DNA-binding GntR family transcriptional regulator|uniref:GntR family transcriptional regulator n=1 Tax=Aureimonas sp. AU22 TaxID=1638162 RepID=UPI000782582C|nr:GntR family transcriptional regulator [Aureimonas sp. AU22]
MTKHPKRTQADMIREVLSDRIVHGILRPGEALDETSLAAEFGVSRTPIREALRQLESIGLALSRPHRGTIVTNVGERELHDIFRVMGELEALCARLSAEAMTPGECEALSHLHAHGAELVLRGDVGGYLAHNEQFHDALYAGSHNGFLEETTRSVRRRLAPFRRMQFEALHRIAHSQREHGAVVAAILDGDADRAARAMLEHLSIVERAVDRISPSHRAAGEDGADPLLRADVG